MKSIFIRHHIWCAASTHPDEEKIILNPIYFTSMMVGAMKTIKISLSIILGAILGPAFYFVSPEWCILFGGITAGTVAFLIGEINDK